jgi:serine/threonine protein kinase
MDPTGSANAATFIGTLSYMSPERIVGSDYGCPADVWSIGLTLMTVALGRCPVLDNGRGYWALMHELTDKPPPTLPEGEGFEHFGPEVNDDDDDDDDDEWGSGLVVVVVVVNLCFWE